MKKGLLTALLAGSVAFGVYAETATIDYTYSNNNWVAYGKAKKETIDVAMCINNPSMAGMKIKGIRAYLNTTEGLSETSLWLSKELTIANKVNNPDIASYNVTVEPTIANEYQVGLLSVQLDEPYTLTGEPVYVGYTMTVDDVATNGEKYPIILSTNLNENGFFLHMSKSVLKWTEYSEKGGGVAVIVVEVEGDFPTYSIAPVSVGDIYAADDEPFTAQIGLANGGANPVDKISYSYTIDGGALHNAMMELDTPIEPSLTSVVPVEFNFESVSGIGAHKVNVTIETTNGNVNESQVKDIEFTVNVIPFIPVHRPLIEEYTGLWCGWCTRGYLAMEELIPEAFGDQYVPVCWHNGDEMAITSSYPMSVGGFPSASIDRISVIDPYYGSYNDDFGISIDIWNAINTLAVADINVEATIEDGIITVNSNTRFIQDIENANYQIGYILTANDLHKDSWGQGNYYAGQTSSYKGTALEVLTTWPSTVYDLDFNFVAIDVNGVRGIASSLPRSISVNDSYNHEYTFNVASNKLAALTDNLVVNAFVINKDNGRIVNANKVRVSDPASVDAIESAASVISTEYFDITGRRVAEPANGLFIKSEKMSDGSVRSSKVMLNR